MVATAKYNPHTFLIFKIVLKRHSNQKCLEAEESNNEQNENLNCHKSCISGPIHLKLYQDFGLLVGYICTYFHHITISGSDSTAVF